MPGAAPLAIVEANLPSLWALQSVEPYFIQFQPFSFSIEGACEGHSSGQFLVREEGEISQWQYDVGICILT